jgi:hypothetical protein
MSHSRTKQRRGANRNGKYSDKYRLAIKPLKYEGQFARFNDPVLYPKGPLLTRYVHKQERVRIYPESIMPADRCLVYLNVHSGHGKYNEPPVAIYTAANGWNNDIASFMKYKKNEPSQAND